ncbi:MAG: PAS domain-containing protein [Ignavibacteriales bacterium]|nr:PAS domain-containing protein [Ignavibacteriales bacterium]
MGVDSQEVFCPFTNETDGSITNIDSCPIILQSFDRLPLPIVIFHPERERVAYANEAATKLYGVEREKLLGNSMMEFSANPSNGKRALETVLEEGRLSNFETTHLRADGEPMRIMVNAVAVRFGDETAIFSVNIPVGDPPKEDAPDETYRGKVAIVVDRDGRVLDYNRLASERVCLFTDAPLSKDEAIVVSDDNLQARFKANLARAFEGERFLSHSEVEYEGERILLAFSYEPDTNENGDVERVWLVATRCTRCGLRARKLREKLELRDQFLSIFSHDLRDIFQGMLGLSASILEMSGAISVAEEQRFIAKINELAGSGYAMLDNLLRWSRSQGGGDHPVCEIISVAESVRRVAKTHHIAAENNGVVMRIAVPSSSNVFADRNALESILRNLITNAIKYARGGEVKIVTNDLGSRTEIIVRDNGVGFEPARLAEVMDAEHRVSRCDKTDKPGAGVGLRLTRDLLNRMNGSLIIRSEPGAGTTVSVMLPKYPSLDEDDAPPSDDDD